MADEKSAQRNPPGPIGRNVIANIEQLRQARGLSYDALATALGGVGHPINPVSLSRLGRGERRVGADDLIAFALALGVNPNAILFDRRAKRGDMLDLTATFRQRADIVWDWADGREPMPAHQVDEGGVVRRTLAEQLEFAATARPALAARLGHPAALAIGQLAAAVQGLLLYLDEGDEEREDKREKELGKRRTEVRRSLQRVTLELDELLGDEGNGQG